MHARDEDSREDACRCEFFAGAGVCDEADCGGNLGDMGFGEGGEVHGFGRVLKGWSGKGEGVGGEGDSFGRR